jgi:hypothetical protein
MEKVPTPKQILAELKEVYFEAKETETCGDLIECQDEMDRLLDLYIDLGYLAGSKFVILEPEPLQGYE